MDEIEKLKNWYTEYKENKLKTDIKRCNTIAVVAGSVATLSSIVVASNLMIGNGIEALQTGGSMAAMVFYVLGNLKMKKTYEKDLISTQETKEGYKDITTSRLEALKYELEILKTSITMDKAIAGGFYLSALGHILELITIPTAPAMIVSTACAALAGFVGTLYVILTKKQKDQIIKNQEETEKIKEIQELENKLLSSLPELLELEEQLQIPSPEQTTETRTVRLGKLRHSK